MKNVVILKNLIVLWQIIYNTPSSIYISVWHTLSTLLSYYLHISSLWYTFITWLWTQIVSKTVWVYHNYKETEKLPMSANKVLHHSQLRWETYSSLMLESTSGKHTAHPHLTQKHAGEKMTIFFLFLFKQCSWPGSKVCLTVCTEGSYTIFFSCFQCHLKMSVFSLEPDKNHAMPSKWFLKCRLISAAP